MIPMTECRAENKIKGILLVTKGKASNNLVKHLKNGDMPAIQKQIKRGSVKVSGTAKP